MVQRQMTEEHELWREHALQQNETLSRLLEDAQREQMTELSAKQDRYVKLDFSVGKGRMRSKGVKK